MYEIAYRASPPGGALHVVIMRIIMKKFGFVIVEFMKKDIVFSIAFMLALVSSVFVRPGVKVIEGIDFRTLVLLFSLMTVVGGLQRQFLFHRIGNTLILKIGNKRTLYFLLIILCFLFSMVLTNDVALITFVPFAVMVLPMADCKKELPLIVVLQTLAANLGSVLTPLGNPQNLYLYNYSGMSLLEFLLWMLPMWLISLFLVVIPIFFMTNGKIGTPKSQSLPKVSKRRQFAFLGLFILCLLCVLKVIDYKLLLLFVLIVALVFDYQAVFSVDFILLLTFVGFFVFVYNVKQVPEIVDWISKIVSGREFVVGILASQIISNVPAALLLSGFTNQIKILLLAVDVGGMGTLIASMASLISYKLYTATIDSNKGKYMLLFTGFNVAYLIIIFAFCVLWYGISL